MTPLKTLAAPAASAIVQLWKRNRSVRALVVVVLLHFAISFVYITVFAITFGFGRRLVLVHLLFVVAFLLFFLLFSCVISGATRLGQLTRRVLISAIATLAFSALLVLYMLDFVSNRFWFESVSFEVIVNNVFYLQTYLRAVNVNVNWVWLGLAVLISVLSFTYFILSKSAVTAFEELSRRGRNYLFANRRRTMQTIVGFVFLVIAYGASLIFLISVIPYGTAYREPILALIGANSLLSRTTLETEVEQLRIRRQYSVPRTFNRKNVILIIVDSLRADHMGLYGYERETTPFLSRMVQEGKLHKVELAAANCSFSTCGILSTLTSRNVDKLSPVNIRMYDLLHDQGYRVNLILSGIHSSLGNLRQSYGRSIDYYFDGKSSKSFDPHDDRLLFEGLAGVPDYQGTPGFFYIHLMSAHVFGERLSVYDKYQPALKETFDWEFPSYSPVALRNTYDNRVLQADGIINDLFSALQQNKYLANSIVVILSDHGEALGEHNHFNHGDYLYQEDIHIPLLIYDPELAPGEIKFGTQVDVAPTIFDLLGLPIPDWWDGRSLLKPDDNGFSYHQTYENFPIKAAVIYRVGTSVYKYIRWNSTEELYDLAHDPGENNNLIKTADPAILSRLRAKLMEHRDFR